MVMPVSYMQDLSVFITVRSMSCTPYKDRAKMVVYYVYKIKFCLDTKSVTDRVHDNPRFFILKNEFKYIQIRKL